MASVLRIDVKWLGEIINIINAEPLNERYPPTPLIPYLQYDFK
jgi:hypothetical protein